jgi:hypothetical protein
MITISPLVALLMMGLVARDLKQLESQLLQDKNSTYDA